jgi:AP-4 complex subunit epsilon-1
MYRNHRSVVTISPSSVEGCTPCVGEIDDEMASGGINLSTEFFELIKAIGESKSKQEEDRIISKEVQKLKTKLETPNGLQNKKRAKEFLVRLLYVEMLGHDGSFGYIKAVEMAASSSLYHKRTGYLVCGACLPPAHEFRFMLVNQMQRDLQSSNVLECSGGLLACTTLITADMVPAVATEVSKLLAHESATIRKKTIIALHRFYQLAPDVVPDLADHTRRALCDKDPSVMGSCLNVIYALCLEDPAPFKDLVPSLVSILKQINEHRLPSDYDYHRCPAPWMQILLVRTLGILGHADVTASNGMYEMLHTTLRNADTGINAGYAIVYECVKTIVSIYPNPKLMVRSKTKNNNKPGRNPQSSKPPCCLLLSAQDAAADAIARFIDSKSNNLKYLGVTGLALIVESHPQYAAQHQLAVMDCLEDADETLQRKTLDLLYRMTNPVNVEFIADKLVLFLDTSTDLFLKKQLTSRVCDIAERYAPSNAWYIQTITKVLRVAGDLVDSAVAQNLMSLLAEGTGNSDEDDMLLRQTAVELYVGLLDHVVLPKILLHTLAWCLGEYGYLSTQKSLDEMLDALCNFMSTCRSDTETKRFLMSAIFKLVAQSGTCPPKAAALIDEFTRSVDPDLQQRCLEFQGILTNTPDLLAEIFPVDASAEDVDVDINLSFLDGYVSNALHHGAPAYDPSCYDDEDDDADDYGATKASSGFKMTPYEKPQTPSTVNLNHGQFSLQSTSGQLPTSSSGGSSGPASSAAAPAPPVELSLNTRNVANVWGKGGMNKAAPAAPPAPAAPAANTTWGPPAPAAAPPSSWNSSSAPAGSWGPTATSSAGEPSAGPVKSAAQLERERQAAALFGGMVPGAAPPPPPQPVVRAAAAPVRAAAPIAPAAPPPVSAPPAPAPDVDLLDMGAWDTPAASEPTTASAPAPVFDDTFSPTPGPLAPVIVETVSDDDYNEVAAAPVAAAPQPPASLLDEDPFASAGLLGLDKPLPALVNQQRFEFAGSPLTPWPITTAEFGQQWGLCPAVSPLSVAKQTTVDAFMELCHNAGAHKIEVIGTEAICAAKIGSLPTLIHGKISAGRVDVTVKSTDKNLASSLAMYLQTKMR